jgi:hypothetical protein
MPDGEDGHGVAKLGGVAHRYALNQILTFFDPRLSTIVEVCDRGGQREVPDVREPVSQDSWTPKHLPLIVTVRVNSYGQDPL